MKTGLAYLRNVSSSGPFLKSTLAEICVITYNMLRIQNGKPLYRPEHVYVVTNEGTFSAAFHFTHMLWKIGTTIVGVPSSQAPNTFMESTPFTLPNITGLRVA